MLHYKATIEVYTIHILTLICRANCKDVNGFLTGATPTKMKLWD